MSIVNLLLKTKKLGIQIWVEKGTLKYKAPSGALNDEIKAEIISNKDEIIRFLEVLNGEYSPLSQIKSIPRDKDIPLSYGQKWLWLHNQMDEQSSAYNIPTAFRLKGELNYKALIDSLNRIIQRHEVLRTNYINNKGDVNQIISHDLKIELPLFDISKSSQKEKEERVMVELNQELSTPFNLAQGLLMRSKLLKLSEEEHVLVLGFHHIICDNQSLYIFLNELITLYPAYLKGQNAGLPELSIQYADYAKWQNERLNSGLKELQLSYWKEKLKDIENVQEICGDYNRPEVLSYKSIRKNYLLPVKTASKLKSVSQKYGHSLYVTLLSIFKILLYQYSGVRDIFIGSPVAGRERSDLENLIGLFFNTVVIRTVINETMRFTDLLEEVKESSSGAFLNQEIPFDLLVEELKPPRKRNKTPIFQVLFNMYNARYNWKMEGVEIEPYSQDIIGVQNINSKFDITLLAIEHELGIQMDFSFKADLYSEKTVNWLIGHFEILTASLADHPELFIYELPELKPVEPEPVLINRSYTPFPKEETEQSLISRFEKQVESNPKQIAVEMNNDKITYLELKTLASRLSGFIKSSIENIPRLSRKRKNTIYQTAYFRSMGY